MYGRCKVLNKIKQFQRHECNLRGVQYSISIWDTRSDHVRISDSFHFVNVELVNCLVELTKNNMIFKLKMKARFFIGFMTSKT